VPVLSSTNKIDRHDITDILLKVALNTTTLAGSRIGQILHTRIRTESSALKDHLYKKYIEANLYGSNVRAFFTKMFSV
jgi:hypothetical protein